MKSNGVFDRIPVAGGVRERLYRATRAAHARFAQGLPLLGDGPGVVDKQGENGRAAALDATNNSDMTHAWLLTGPPGSGRSVTARAFAAALLCTNHQNPGCGQCQGCRTALAGTHGDLNNVSTDGTVIQVEKAREVREWAYRMPTTARCRVVIIEDADRLNDSAANAILKVVEEPPKSTVIIMCSPTANAEDFSVTLRSRCRHVYIPTPSAADVMSVLYAENPSLNDDQLRWAAAVSAGHIGRARGLVNDEGTRDWRALALNFVEAVFDPARSYLLSQEIATQAVGESKRRLEEVERQELEKLEDSLGIGAKGKGAQAALRGSKGILDALEKEQKRRRIRTEKDLIDMSLTDIMGLLRDALLLKSGVVPDGVSSDGTGIALINPDRRRTAEELSRRLSSESLLKSIDAVLNVRNQLNTALSPAVLMDQLMASLQLACHVGER